MDNCIFSNCIATKKTVFEFLNLSIFSFFSIWVAVVKPLLAVFFHNFYQFEYLGIIELGTVVFSIFATRYLAHFAILLPTSRQIIFISKLYTITTSKHYSKYQQVEKTVFFLHFLEKKTAKTVFFIGTHIQIFNTLGMGSG